MAVITRKKLLRACWMGPLSSWSLIISQQPSWCSRFQGSRSCTVVRMPFFICRLWISNWRNVLHSVQPVENALMVNLWLKTINLWNPVTYYLQSSLIGPSFIYNLITTSLNGWTIWMVSFSIWKRVSSLSWLSLKKKAITNNKKKKQFDYLNCHQTSAVTTSLKRTCGQNRRRMSHEVPVVRFVLGEYTWGHRVCNNVPVLSSTFSWSIGTHERVE